MDVDSRTFKRLDGLFILMMTLPVASAIAIKAVTDVPAEGINIAGARIFFTVPMPVQDWPITESQINSWLVIIAIWGICLYLTHGIVEKGGLKRQLAAEWIVDKTTTLVKNNMGELFIGFAPFVAAIMVLSAFSSLMSLFGLFPPTSDLNVVAGWAAVTFILITYYKMKGGFVQYLRGFLEPVPLLAPINVISELATPISMSFRHYGNILSGTVIAALVASGLGGLSNAVLGWIPIIGDLSLLRIGIPAVLSVYFDVFSGCLQAYIFAMLTMVYVRR